MFGDTPLLIVDTPEKLVEMCDALQGEPVIGVDLEADSMHHYQEKICLIQVSNRTRDFIVDPIVVDDLSLFGAILEDPNVVKVLHGGDYDVVSLKRDYSFSINNVFDTMLGAQFAGLDRFGLADLIRKFFGHTIDKKYQRYDWSLRPLGKEHLDYARGDTHFLLAIRELLTHKLTALNNVDAHREECERLTEREWKGRDPETAFLNTKKCKGLDEVGLKVLRAVWEYREVMAHKLDRPCYKVLGDPVLVQLATLMPASPKEMNPIMKKGSSMERRFGSGCLEAVQKGIEDTRPIPKVKVEKARRKRGSAASVDKLFLALKNWRNSIVNKNGLNSVTVISNSVLKDIACESPKSTAELTDVKGMRKWQLDRYGDQVLGIVNKL